MNKTELEQKERHECEEKFRKKRSELDSREKENINERKNWINLNTEIDRISPHNIYSSSIQGKLIKIAPHPYNFNIRWQN